MLTRTTRPLNKLARLISGEKLVATHNGVFHCDDAMACALLTKYTAAFQNARVIRSRDLSTLDAADAVVDVGGHYDTAQNRFDHHQRGFEQTFSSTHSIKLSSAGLVYKHYGRECLLKGKDYLISGNRIPSWIISLITPEELDILFLKLYDNFFMTIDAIDNGVEMVSSDVVKAYEMYPTDLASRVSRLNMPWWKEADEKEEMNAFKCAMQICNDEFLAVLEGFIMSTIGTRRFVEKDLTENCMNEGKILLLSQSCSWKAVIEDIEKKLAVENRTRFVVYKDRWSLGYRVQAVPAFKGSFQSRHLLKCEWRGLSGNQLEEASGIQGALFVHHSGFIGGGTTKDSCIKMAQISLDK
jgi:uncharacterized UPF0160 family protein